MSSIILFLVTIGVIGAWWLSKQRLMAKPWLEEGVAVDFRGTEQSRVPAIKVGLGIFLAVVGSLFALLISAYSMRMEMADWRPVPSQTMLWPVTGMLIMSSVALEWAKVAERREDFDVVRISLMAAGLFTLAFVSGQLLVLRQLTQSGFFAREQSGKLLLLSHRRSARNSRAGRRHCSRKDDRQRLARSTQGRLELEHLFVRHLLALSVSHLACFVRSADRVGRRLRRHLSAVVNLGCRACCSTRW